MNRPLASPTRVLVTGGAGFMGSQLVRTLARDGWDVVVLDKLTYAARREHLDGVPCKLLVGDVCDPEVVEAALDGVDAVIHAAAESHVSRSFDDPGSFVRTNIDGTRVMLAAAQRRAVSRFIHISTDEVFGSAAPGISFKACDPLTPGNPYAASKVGAEAMVHAWRHTWSYPAAIVRCTNNYGPRQHPEKAIPGWILAALDGAPLRIHGFGTAVRDWLHVEDFARGVATGLAKWRPGAVWHFAGRQHLENRVAANQVAKICGDAVLAFEADRPGQDARYDLDDEATRRELGWAPRVGLVEGLNGAVNWYRQHRGLWSTDE